MARITVEDCLDNVENRFELVMIASKRARQLQTGGKEPLVSEDNDKPTVLALREVADGLIDASILSNIPEEMEVIVETEEVAKSNDISIEEAMDAVLIPEASEEEPEAAPAVDVDPVEDEQ